MISTSTGLPLRGYALFALRSCGRRIVARQQGAEVGYALVHGYGAVFDKKMPGKKPGIEYRCNPREERSIALMILFKHAMAGGDLSERNKSKIDFYWKSGEDRS